MGSLFEELEAREAAARLRVEELEAEVAELSGKLELAREGLERLRIARETVAEVLAEMTPEKLAVAVDTDRPTSGELVASAYAGAERRVIGVLTGPNC
jgi:predicted  nucleic acid-binding Zn-ribbon protein